MKIPSNAPARFNHRIGDEIAAAVHRVLDSGWYVLGPEVEAFESEFAEYCGTTHCVGVASGTDALELALRGVGVRPGSEVVTVANAGMYSTTAILAIGALPRFADVDPRSMGIVAQSIEATLSPRTAAIVVTHLYGKLVPMEPILGIARQHGLPVIEDCAQAHGAQRNAKRAGSFGTVGCFSFYPTKNLGALGDGGALTTSDDQLYRKLVALRQYGWETKYRSTRTGGRNSRLDELQAAVLRRKLTHLEQLNDERRELARRYNHRLEQTDLELPTAIDSDHVAHLYVVRTADRDRRLAALREQGVGAEVHYPLPDHRQPSMLDTHSELPELPVTEQLSTTVLTLPLFPGMTEIEQDRVISVLVRLSS